MESGEVQPSVRDGLAAMRLIAECEARSGPADVGEWQTEFIALFETVQAIMTTAQFDDLATRLNARNREREASKRGK
jgi:hypothetical protein